MNITKSMNPLAWALGAVVLIASTGSNAQAQVPPDIEASLQKIGQIVDPPCTAKLYRQLMPKNDYNTYWAPGASAPTNQAALYPGITLARDVSFGPNPRDLVDIFTAEKGGASRTVLIYVPGGAGNKIEQQAREANAFYDNIGRWATENGMVGVLMQRHAGTNWDDGGKDISLMIQWVQNNISKYKGDPDRMFIWAHSAGNGPLGVYVGHPELHGPKGVGVKGAVFMSGNPVQGLGAPGGGAAGGARGGPALAAAGSTCGVAAGSTEGVISGPSGAAPAGPRGGAGGGRGGPPQLDAATQAARSNLPGFKTTKVAILLARAELDPGVTGTMAASDIALHDELCKEDGPKAKDGAGHCPTMLFLKGESHMSEVFSIGTPDKTVSGPILAWMKKVK
ncbi:MAG TPA: carboxylesterase family protein [Terriglobia bacterium]|nr:carboxylesterase family protein [Terriglobia bacterium]